MREALEFECCSAAHSDRTFQQRLKRYHHVLPTQAFVSVWDWQLRGRAAVHAPRHLIEPAMSDVLAS